MERGTNMMAGNHLTETSVCYRVLPRKRELIPRGTHKHKSNAFPFTRTVQIAKSPSPEKKSLSATM